jgi:hypothetical protein
MGEFRNVSVFPDSIKIGTDSLFNDFQCSDMLFEPLSTPRDLGLGKNEDCDALIAVFSRTIRTGSSSKMFIRQAD